MMDPFAPINAAMVESLAFDDDERGKLFVGGLSWDTTHSTLLQYFGKFGEVIDCVVMKNQQTGKSRGFGFVRFKDPNVVDVVLVTGPHVLDGRQVDPKNCNPRRLNQGGKSAENSRRKIFIGGLPATCDESQLKEVFRKYGPVEDATIMYDQEKNRSRGFGFLTYESDVSVDKVCSEHFIYINGKQVECKRAEPRQVKSMADTGSPVLIAPQGAQGVVFGVAPASGAAFGIGPNMSQGSMSMNSGSPQQLPSPVGAAVQHPGAPFLAAPGLAMGMVPFNPAAAFGGPGYYCVHEQGVQFHPAPLGPHAMQGMIGLPGGGLAMHGAGMGGGPGFPPGAGGMAGASMAGGMMGAGVGMPGAGLPASGMAFSTCDTSAPKNMQVYGPAEGMTGVRQMNGSESAAGGAQISFQPQVTYTLAPGVTPMQGNFGPIYPGGPAAMQAAGDAPGTPQYLQHITPSIGRIQTNHGAAFLPHFHPYLRPKP